MIATGDTENEEEVEDEDGAVSFSTTVIVIKDNITADNIVVLTITPNEDIDDANTAVTVTTTTKAFDDNNTDNGDILIEDPDVLT